MKIKQTFPRILTALGLISIVLVCTPAALAWFWEPTVTTGTGDCGDFTQDVSGCNRTQSVNVDELHNKKTMTRTWTDTATGEAVTHKWVWSTTAPYKLLSEAEERTYPSGESHGFTDDWQNNKHTKFARDAAGNEEKNVYDGDNRLIFHKESHPDGSGNETTYDPQTGRTTKTQNWGRDGKHTIVVYNPDGSSNTTTYGRDGKVTSTVVFNPDGSKTTTTYSRDGSVTVTKYGPDGKAIAKTRTDGKTGEVIVYNCHLKGAFSNEECVDMSRGPRGLGLYGSDRPQDTPRPQSHERAGDAFENVTNAPQIMPGLKPAGELTDAKDKVKADVLGQIEGKPRGDLIGVRDKTSTGVADQIKKRGDAVGLNPQPLPPGPQPDKSIRLKDTTKLEGPSVGKDKTKAGFARGEIPPGTKVGVPKTYNPDRRKLNTDKMLQSTLSGPQTGVTKQFKTNSGVKDWGSSAGSPRAYPGLR